MASVADLRYHIDAVDKGFESTITKLGRHARAESAAIERSSSSAAGVVSGRLGGALGRVGGVTGKVGTGLKMMGGVALTAGAALGGLAFAKIAGEGLQMAATLESTTAGFTTMLGSAEKADAFVKEMFAFAANTPFEFAGLAQSAQMMMAMGFEADEVLPTLTKVGDAVGSLGGGSEQVNRVVRALGQMQAKGRVSGEEMLQLTEAGIPAWQFLADKIGITVPEAQERARKGQLDLATTMDAIINGMGDKYAGGMDKQAKTITGLISTLKDNVGLMLANIVTPFMPMIKGAIGWLSKLAETAGPKIASALDKVLPKVKAFVDTAGPVLKRVLDRVLPVIKSFRAWLGQLGEKVMPVLREAWDKISGSLKDAMPGLKNIAGIFIIVGKAMVEKVLPPLIKFAGVVISNIITAVGWFGKILPPVAKTLLQFGIVIVGAFRAVIGTVWGLAEGIVKAAAAAFGWVPGIGPKIEEAARRFSDTKDAFLGTIDGVADGMSRASDEVDRFQKNAKLDMDIAEATKKLDNIKEQLKDPNLTKERRAKLTADAAQQEAAIAKALAAKDGLKDPELVKEREAKLTARKEKLDTAIAQALAELSNPSLTKERRAEINARIDKLIAKRKEVTRQMEKVKDKTITINAKVIWENYRGDGGITGYNPRTGEYSYRPGAGGDGGPSPYKGILKATAGKGVPGATFGQWGPYWSWNRRNGMGQHDGADVKIGYGAGVYASKAGSVVATGNFGWAGKHVIWKDANSGTRFLYAHLSAISRYAGPVWPGMRLGAVGSTGNSTGPHLHVQASRSGHYVDPAAWLADGAIVRRRPGGVLVGVGEGEHDEAIVPLPRSWERGGGGTQPPVHVHFHLDGRDIQQSLIDYESATGRYVATTPRGR